MRSLSPLRWGGVSDDRLPPRFGEPSVAWNDTVFLWPGLFGVLGLCGVLFTFELDAVLSAEVRCDMSSRACSSSSSYVLGNPNLARWAARAGAIVSLIIIWNEAAMARDSPATASTRRRPLDGEQYLGRGCVRSYGGENVPFSASLLSRLSNIMGDREREGGSSGRFRGSERGEDVRASERREVGCKDEDLGGICGVDKLASGGTVKCVIASKSSRIETAVGNRRLSD